MQLVRLLVTLYIHSVHAATVHAAISGKGISNKRHMHCSICCCSILQ